jgi:hypothetical protein
MAGVSKDCRKGAFAAGKSLRRFSEPFSAIELQKRGVFVHFDEVPCSKNPLTD